MLRFETTGGLANSFHCYNWPARAADITWVSTFRQTASYTRYTPHITIAIGATPLTVEPFSFTSHEIAICRLGRFCTCREKLATWPLVEETGPPAARERVRTQ